MEQFDYVPKINKRSASMAEFNKKKYKEKDIFNRLAQKDPYMVEGESKENEKQVNQQEKKDTDSNEEKIDI